MQYYYLNDNNVKDGPHDLISIMRRIRSGTINPDTFIYIDKYDENPQHAFSISDLSQFFNSQTQDIRKEIAKNKVSIIRTISQGWGFTKDNILMAVLAGGVLIITTLFGILLSDILSPIAGFTAGWIMFLFLQSCFLAISLRIYRGQKIDIAFIEHNLSPIIAKLSFVAVIFAILIPIGLIFCIVPGIVAIAIAMYIPLLIFDYNLDVRKTIYVVFQNMGKFDQISLLKFGLLILLYLICISFIFPIILILPIFAGGLCSIYEDFYAD